jgi:hypothetical protein
MSGSLPGCSHPQTLNAPLPPPPSDSVRCCSGHPNLSAATQSRLTCPLRQTNQLYLNCQAGRYLGGVARKSRLREPPGFVDLDQTAGSKLGGRVCLLSDIPIYPASPPARPNPRGSSHSKEPKPGRPRLTYLIAADPTWSGWGRMWVASVVQSLRILPSTAYTNYHGPTVHGRSHTKTAWLDHAVDHHLSGQYLMAIGRFIRRPKLQPWHSL